MLMTILTHLLAALVGGMLTTLAIAAVHAGKREDRARDIGALDGGKVRKGGHNDLSRWKAFGGDLERPPAPGALNPKPERIK